VSLAERAVDLATSAVRAGLPQAGGYLGVDLVLGRHPRGADDFVIEVNPRITTSYVGLRAAYDTNLAAAILRVADDREPDLRLAAGKIQFGSDGAVIRRQFGAGSDP
jgi:predicted ATP-grasp superfamily ATP-dependent carboligase